MFHSALLLVFLIALNLVHFGCADVFDTIDSALQDTSVEDTIDNIEEYAKSAGKLTVQYKQLLKAATGGFIFLYGSQFPCSLLILQSALLTGLPGMGESWRELVTAYKKMRTALKKEVPEMRKTKEKFHEAVALRRDLKKQTKNLARKNNGISADDFTEQSKALESALADVTKLERELASISGSLQRVFNAVDPSKLQGVLTSMYLALGSSVASVSYKMLGQVTMGLHFGRSAAERLMEIITRHSTNHSENEAPTEAQKLIQTFMENNKLWLSTAVASASSAIGISTVVVFKKMAFTFSASTMGVQMMINSAIAGLDPYLEAVGLPTMRGNPGRVAIVQTGLVAIGIWRHLTGSNELPTVVKLLLSPLYALELLLQALFPSAVI